MQMPPLLRRSGLLLTLAVLVATALIGASNLHAAPSRISTSQAPAAKADGGIKTSAVMCEIANIAGAGAAGARLKNYGASRGIVGAFLADLFLSSLKVHCAKAVDGAGRVLARMFRDERKPTRQISSRSTILRLLDDQSAAQIATNVVVGGKPVSTTYVVNGADETCRAFRNQTPAMSVIARYFPGAKLSVITPMNGFVRLVISRCRLNAHSASFLGGAMVNYLLSNESARDLEAPTAWIHSATGIRYTNGTAELKADWVGSDRGSGVRAYAVWMWRDGYWYQLSPDTASTGWKITLRQGIQYQWAVRAIDSAGNVSPWSYSPVYSA